MSYQHMNRVMAALFLIAFLSYLVIQANRKPRVLILHSYDTDYSWTREVNEGIRRKLGDKPYSVRWHYMDTKRHPDREFKQRAATSARRVIDEWQPDVLLAVADNAQDLVARHYVDHPDMSIVFCGVFAHPGAYGYSDRAGNLAGNVTGILERWPMQEIRESLEELFVRDTGRERPLEVYHLGDRSETGLLIAEQITSFDWGERLALTSIEVGTMTDWEQAIMRINREADVALFSLYHTLQRAEGTSDVIPPAEVMAFTQRHLDKPGIGGWGFYVEQGGMMAIGVSAYEQGEEAATMAVNVIEHGTRPATPTQSQQYLIYLREPLLVRHGVTVPRMFEAFARATNNYYADSE